MSLVDRHLKPLMRQIATQDVVEIIAPGDFETAGALAYVAECSCCSRCAPTAPGARSWPSG